MGRCEAIVTIVNKDLRVDGRVWKVVVDVLVMSFGSSMWNSFDG